MVNTPDEIAAALSGLGTPAEAGMDPALVSRLRTLVTSPAAEIPAGMIAPNPAANQQGILGTLRQRVKDQIANEGQRLASDIGIGLMTSRSPNFFTALGEGLQRGNEGSRSRMDELRRVAEAEQNAQRIAAEEAFRIEQNRIQAERYAAEAPLRAAQAQYYLRGGAAGVGGGGTSTRPPSTQLTAQQLATIRSNAEAQALRDIPEPSGPNAIIDTPEARADRIARRRARADQLEAAALEAARRAVPGGVPEGPTPSASPAAPAVPRITVGPTGQPVPAR